MSRFRCTLVAVVMGVLALLVSGSSATAAGPPWWEPVSPQTPDSEVDVVGEPFTGTTATGEVRGLVDAHTHMFSDEGFGGNVICGRTFSAHGIADALRDCPAHQPDGRRALIENLTNARQGGNPFASHDTVGWPTFRFWPAYDSFTHQQMYYKWVERAWRGGQRILVNDLVSNSGLCTINGVVNAPNRSSCNDMDAVRREARLTRELEAFVDAQYGGAGQGWFRIVTTPAQARSVVEQGKLAVVLGVEVSEPFGCKQTLTIPACGKAQIDRGLDELKALGVSSMFLCHKFDNALCGVRYDEGTTGVIVNLGQFLTTGTWWNPRTCRPGEVPDHTVAGGVLPKELAVAFPLAVLPVYPVGPHCNPRGLTSLGEYAVRGLVKRHMMVEVDHMSAKAAARTFSILEETSYAGALSSHSWLAEPFMQRLYSLGGFATQYGHGTTEFVADWRASKAQRDRFGVGYGFGMDMNGFGGTPPPREGAATSAAGPVVYPFRSVDGGSVLSRQRTGDRVWDVNVDGVAHYGQVPDWVEDLRIVGGQELVDDLMAGAESYLRTWERAAAN
ncbi:Coagulation factor 5/8 type domain-containing protein [Knoellia sp. LjRoot47]|uniref:Coagulation factor 5/8 type domain-containing protein n=1 Tax=Knoellia sp. LjRoot47 TaxID=3342330 RepID=UPI003ECD1EEB